MYLCLHLRQDQAVFFKDFHGASVTSLQELVVVETYTKKEKPSEVFTKLLKEPSRQWGDAGKIYGILMGNQYIPMGISVYQ